MEKLGKVGKNYEKRDLTWLVDQRKDKSTIKAHGGYIQLAVFVFYSLQSNLADSGPNPNVTKRKYLQLLV